MNDQAPEVLAFIQEQAWEMDDVQVFGWGQQTDVRFFGISDPGRISSIIGVLTTARQERGWRPLYILFAEGQYWTKTATPDGGFLEEKNFGEIYRETVVSE